jgi:hypothetical protein
VAVLEYSRGSNPKAVLWRYYALNSFSLSLLQFRVSVGGRKGPKALEYSPDSSVHLSRGTTLCDWTCSHCAASVPACTKMPRGTKGTDGY